MNLFELFVKIGVDDQASSKLKDIGGKLGNGLKKAAEIGTKAVGVASTAIAGLTTAAIKNYAEYEQLVGGAQLMFGKAYDTVAKNAQNAYKTVQMSQNEYLQQVNGFATGLKTSLDGNEQAAAELAHRIIQAEADIVAATGNSKEAVQNAFNGIMKSNFTMLDNLQIGITPTKEGFQEVIDKVNEWNKANGEATNYQMGNLADMQSALVDYIDMVGMSGYAQAEASKTIQGSLASMKSAWSNLLTGVADDNADFDMLVNNFVESAGTVAENLLPRIEIALEGAGKLVDKLLPVIMDKIPNFITKYLPKLAKSGVNILKSLVKGIKDNIREITAAAKDIVLDLIDGLLDMLPDIIDAGVELLCGIIEAIPDAVAIIKKHMPEIISAVTRGLLSGTWEVAKAAVRLFEPIEKELEVSDEIKKQFREIADSVSPFFDAVDEFKGKTIDLSNALSENGRTISEIDDEIQTVEEAITNILREEYKEQDGLRQDEIKNIEDYLEQLRLLRLEELGIYQGAIETEYYQIVSALEKGDISQDEAKKYLADLGKAYEEANEKAEEFYNADVSTRTEIYKSQGETESQAHKDSLLEAENHYEESLKTNEKYYDDALKAIASGTKGWIKADADMWKKLQKNRDDFYKEGNYSLTELEKKDKELYDIYNTGSLFGNWALWLTGTSDVGYELEQKEFETDLSNYLDTLEQIDKDAASAFLSLQASAVDAGAVLDTETAGMVLTIINSFDNLPEELQEDGAVVLRSIVSGMESELPELEKASEMNAQEIVDALKGGFSKGMPEVEARATSELHKRFGVPSPIFDQVGKDGESIGENLAAGIETGIQSGFWGIASTIETIGFETLKKFKEMFAIRSPSRKMRDEIGKNIILGLAEGISDYSHFANDAASDVSSSLIDSFNSDYEMSVKANMENSPITDAFSKTLGAVASIDQEKAVDVNINVKSDETELGRVLVNLLNITSKEVGKNYAYNS